MKLLHFYFATLALAFCSIVYELLLGQVLSAFLGNTIVRYSITVGLYMCSMGFGALLLPKQYNRNPIISLLKVEIFLSLLGASGPLLLLSLQVFGVEGVIFSFFAHGLIIAVGVLTGFEIPLLIEIGNRFRPHSEAKVLGVDYLGAFLGAVSFAFYFYPQVGIFVTGLILAIVNAIVGLSLYGWQTVANEEEQCELRMLFLIQFGVAIMLLVLVLNPGFVNQLAMDMYLGE
ncbi:MAG: hypothetical protein KDD70_08385 [Bdellovibrionales bacterium]|nr:hypothetical protein [Bdellovibrionales bacterium]